MFVCAFGLICIGVIGYALWDDYITQVKADYLKEVQARIFGE